MTAFTTPRSASAPPLNATDILEIQALIFDYVWSIDQRDLERFAELWTTNAGFEMNRDEVGLGVPLCGRDQIVAHFADYLKPKIENSNSFIRHLCTSTRLEPTNTGLVLGTTGLLQVTYLPSSRGAIERRVSRTGLYHDCFQRETAGWRFARRLLAWDPPAVTA